MCKPLNSDWCLIWDSIEEEIQREMKLLFVFIFILFKDREAFSMLCFDIEITMFLALRQCKSPTNLEKIILRDL